jgi:hypothetical protein
MSRQNRNTVRDRKTDGPKRDVVNNERYSRPAREDSPRNQQDRSSISQITGLDRYRLNDLYERSSI